MPDVSVAKTSQRTCTTGTRHAISHLLFDPLGEHLHPDSVTSFALRQANSAQIPLKLSLRGKVVLPKLPKRLRDLRSAHVDSSASSFETDLEFFEHLAESFLADRRAISQTGDPTFGSDLGLSLFEIFHRQLHRQAVKSPDDGR
jgi:hypothetical protein